MTTPDTASATLTRFDHAWDALDKTVKSLGPRELTEIRDPAGWSAKDHLMHLALWEQGLHAKVDGRPRHEVLGLDASTNGSDDWDTLNGAIFANTRHHSLPDVLDALQKTHATTRTRLVSIAAAGPTAETGETATALLTNLPGYIDHYDAHHGWIRELVASR
jgi:DinB superfamily